MKLRNGKQYEFFNWSKVIYQSQLKVSNALITPVEEIVCGNAYIIFKNRGNPIVNNGLKIGLLEVDSFGKITTKFGLQTQSYYKNKKFMKNIRKKLHDSGVKCYMRSYID